MKIHPHPLINLIIVSNIPTSKIGFTINIKKYYTFTAFKFFNKQI